MTNEIEKYYLYRGLLRRVLLFTGLWPIANPTIFQRMVPFVHGTAAVLASCVILNFCRHHAGNLNLFLKGLSLALSFLTMLQKTFTVIPEHGHDRSFADPFSSPDISYPVIIYRGTYGCMEIVPGIRLSPSHPLRTEHLTLDERLSHTGLKPCLMIHLIFAAKTICLVFHRKRLIELHTTLAATFHRDLEDIELRPILLSPLLSFYRPSLILSIVTYTVNALYWVTPVIAIVIQLSHGAAVLKYILPFPSLYPWRVEAGTWRYPVHYAFEVYAGICLGSFTSSIDSLFGYYIFQIAGQLRALSYRVRTFSSTDNYQKVLSECVTRHQTLTRCQNHLERIYGPIVLWMLVTSAMIICALIYQASHMSPSKAVFVTLYIIMKSVQTLLYGWFGTYLTNENENFREAIYASDWPGSGEKCLMTDVLVMMTYKPFVLKACSLSTISVDMFVAVSNTAMSYFFMLRTLEEGSNA